MNKVLVVGCGKMGASHIAILSALIGKSNVILVDTSFFNRYIFKSLGFEVFKDLGNAFKCNPDINRVLIATPALSHKAIIKVLPDNVNRIFVEKPFTLDPFFNERLLKDESDTMYQIGYVLRFNKFFKTAKELLNTKILGKLLDYECKMCGNVITAADTNSWRADTSRGGGVIFEYGSHLLDMVLYLIGSIEQITVDQRNKILSKNAFDEVSCTLEHADDVKGRLYLNWCMKEYRKSHIEFKINCDFGSLIINQNGLKIESDDSEANRITNDYLQQYEQQIPYYLRGEEYTAQLCEFLAADKTNSIASDLHQGIKIDDLLIGISNG